MVIIMMIAHTQPAKRALNPAPCTGKSFAQEGKKAFAQTGEAHPKIAEERWPGQEGTSQASSSTFHATEGETRQVENTQAAFGSSECFSEKIEKEGEPGEV